MTKLYSNAFFVVLFSICFSALTSTSFAYRYWYDGNYENRVSAVLSSYSERGVELRTESGKFLRVDRENLSNADQAYLEGYRYAAESAKYLDQSPYTTGDRELSDLRRMLKSRGVSPELAKKIGTSQNQSNNVELHRFVGRWVEINGIPYQVSSIEVSESVTGIHSIVVQTSGQRYFVDPAQVGGTIRVLPDHIEWTSPRLQLNEIRNPFRRRAPPIREFGDSEDAWEAELVFDEIEKRLDGRTVTNCPL